MIYNITLLHSPFIFILYILGYGIINDSGKIDFKVVMALLTLPILLFVVMTRIEKLGNLLFDIIVNKHLLKVTNRNPSVF